jgi:site-specific DNA-methyltransferase (adenine-specific)
MPVRDLCSLRPLLDKVVHKNSVLLLYVVLSKLPEALQVMAAWGYKYVTTPFTFVKLNATGSVETRGRDILLKGGIRDGVEIVLMGKRGRGRSRKCKSTKQIVFAPCGEKSEEIRVRIDRAFGSLPKLELFASGGKVKGWLKLGSDCDIREALKELVDAQA